MNEPIRLILTLAAGLGLGTLFFYGLWLTVQRMPTTRNPALWTLGSFVGRVSVTVAGFYFVGQGHWHYLLVCLLGFVVARFLVTYLTRSGEKEPLTLKKPIAHES